MFNSKTPDSSCNGKSVFPHKYLCLEYWINLCVLQPYKASNFMRVSLGGIIGTICHDKTGSQQTHAYQFPLGYVHVNTLNDFNRGIYLNNLYTFIPGTLHIHVNWNDNSKSVGLPSMIQCIQYQYTSNAISPTARKWTTSNCIFLFHFPTIKNWQCQTPCL